MYKFLLFMRENTTILGDFNGYYFFTVYRASNDFFSLSESKENIR